MSVFHERGWNGGVCFWCPACEEAHCVTTEWLIDREAVTLAPSVLVGGVQWPKSGPFYKPGHSAPEGGATVCHSFVRDGRIEYLSDCTHALAGQTVDLPDWPIGDDRGWRLCTDDRGSARRSVPSFRGRLVRPLAGSTTCV